MDSGPWVGSAVKSDGRFTLIAGARHREIAAQPPAIWVCRAGHRRAATDALSGGPGYPASAE
jgi:hypothetical protein